MMATQETLFSQLVQAHRSTHGRLPAIRVGSDVVAYEQLCLLVESAAEGLSMFGVSGGTRVLIALPNSVEYVVAILAVTSLGGMAVPVQTDAGDRRFAYIAEQTRPVLCLLQEKLKHPSGVPTVRVKADLPHARFTIVSEADRSASSRRKPSKPTADSPAVILFSSGSTGHPKGVVLKHRHLLATAHNMSAIFGLHEDHRELVVCSLCHSGAWQRVAATLLGGGCLVLPQGPLVISGLLEDIEQHAITGFYTPPPLVRYLLMTSHDKVRSATATCRSIEIGSAPLAGTELQEVMAIIPTARIFVHYGLTECSRAVILDARGYPGKLHTVGKASPGVEVAVCRDDGSPAATNQEGQIYLRGCQQTEGYWNRPDLDEERFRDGWLMTGDYGSLDEDGFLHYLGRKDDMITSAAHHFFPAEVEGELGQVDGVAQYLIAGVRDRSGILAQVPWAFVVPNNPEGWSPRHFLSEARMRLPRHMIPRRVLTVPSLPLTASGKPDRRRTVELYATPDGKE